VLLIVECFACPSLWSRLLPDPSGWDWL
jgi:hypothetical protein